MNSFNYKALIGVFTLMLFFFSGCGMVTKTKVYAPQSTDKLVKKADLNYLGETTISVSYRTYLGIFSVIDQVNDKEYISEEAHTATFQALPFKGDKLNKATYKILEEFPNASYFRAVRKTTVKDRMFLGSEVKTTALIHVYSYRNQLRDCCDGYLEEEHDK